VFVVRYELGLYTPEDGILHCHQHKTLKYYNILVLLIISGLALKPTDLSTIPEFFPFEENNWDVKLSTYLLRLVPSLRMCRAT
jgi:hypothetical protein